MDTGSDSVAPPGVAGNSFTTADPNFDADAALAKSLMEEDKLNDPSSSIRRPDAAKKDVLMEGYGSGMMGGGMMGGGGGGMMGFGINGAFMPAPPTATWDGDGAVDGTVSHKKDKVS